MNGRTRIYAVLLLLLACPRGFADDVENTQAATLNAISFTRQDVGRETKGAWEISEPGRVACRFDSPVEGLYTFVVMAAGQSEGGVWPRLAFGVNEKVGVKQTVRTSSWGSYTFTRELDVGSHELFLDLLGGEDESEPVLRLAHVTVISPVDAGRVAWVLPSEEEVTNEASVPTPVGTLAVAVIDGSGMAVKGAAIRVLHEALGEQGAGKTDQDGLFSCDAHAGTMKVMAKSRKAGEAMETFTLDIEEGGAASVVLQLEAEADEAVER